MSETITKQTLETRAQNVNRRLRPEGQPFSVKGHYVYVQYQNGGAELQEYDGGACQRALTFGTKREVADFLHAMMVGMDMRKR